MGSVLPQHPGFGPPAGDGACIRILYLDQLGTPQTSVIYTTQSSADLLEFGAELRQAFDLMHAALGLELLSITVGTLAGERLLPGSLEGGSAGPSAAAGRLRLVGCQLAGAGVRSDASPDTAR